MAPSPSTEGLITGSRTVGAERAPGWQLISRLSRSLTRDESGKRSPISGRQRRRRRRLGPIAEFLDLSPASADLVGRRLVPLCRRRHRVRPQDHPRISADGLTRSAAAQCTQRPGSMRLRTPGPRLRPADGLPSRSSAGSGGTFTPAPSPAPSLAPRRLPAHWMSRSLAAWSCLSQLPADSAFWKHRAPCGSALKA